MITTNSSTPPTSSTEWFYEYHRLRDVLQQKQQELDDAIRNLREHEKKRKQLHI